METDSNENVKIIDKFYVLLKLNCILDEVYFLYTS